MSNEPVKAVYAQKKGEWKSKTNLLDNAAVEAKKRNYADFPIVDVDAHHRETKYAPWKEIVKYIEHPVIRMRAEKTMSRAGAPRSMLLESLGDRTVSGRLQRDKHPSDTIDTHLDGVIKPMDSMGIDYSLLFPGTLLNIGILPEIDVQTALTWAYARWITERVLPGHPRLKAWISLPFNDADASLRMVETFGPRPGVIGFVIGAALYRPVHHKMYMKVYSAIEEQGLPLAFHSAYNWLDRLTEQFNKFIAAHGVGRTLYNIMHLTNWVVNGLSERFPGIKVIWIESGLTWVPFLMQRLDAEYLMRSSEAPLLQKKPSEYMRDFYYTSQPLEWTWDNKEMLAMTFEMINAEKRLLYASDYPHWDFDLPSSIYDLPFLTETAKRRILGGNAMDLFKLPPLEELYGSKSQEA